MQQDRVITIPTLVHCSTSCVFFCPQNISRHFEVHVHNLFDLNLRGHIQVNPDTTKAIPGPLTPFVGQNNLATSDSVIFLSVVFTRQRKMQGANCSCTSHLFPSNSTIESVLQNPHRVYHTPEIPEILPFLSVSLKWYQFLFVLQNLCANSKLTVPMYKTRQLGPYN